MNKLLTVLFAASCAAGETRLAVYPEAQINQATKRDGPDASQKASAPSEEDTSSEGLLVSGDRCPMEPETKNGFEDHDGCPDELPRELLSLQGIVEDLVFELGRDHIKPGSRRSLQRIAAVLNKYEDVRIEISAHADPPVRLVESGRETPRRRADAVRRYLTEQGVAESRMEIRGVGPHEPVAGSDTAPGRSKDRRVEIYVLVDQD